MKKLLFLAAVLAVAEIQSAAAYSTPVVASDPEAGAVVAQRAWTMTNALVKNLRLNEAEIIRLQRTHCVLLTSVDAIIKQYANDPATRHAKLTELEGQYEQERLRILTSSQATRMARTDKDRIPAVDTEPGGRG